jgi:hypothetical protein
MAQSAKGLKFFNTTRKRGGKKHLERIDNCWFAAQHLNKSPVRKDIQDKL